MWLKLNWWQRILLFLAIWWPIDWVQTHLNTEKTCERLVTGQINYIVAIQDLQINKYAIGDSDPKQYVQDYCKVNSYSARD